MKNSPEPDPTPEQHQHQYRACPCRQKVGGYQLIEDGCACKEENHGCEVSDLPLIILRKVFLSFFFGLCGRYFAAALDASANGNSKHGKHGNGPGKPGSPVATHADCS